ncbi:MAG: pyridoxal phosphate-dependent aminotransferase [Alphaproteobacteria bacterium]
MPLKAGLADPRRIPRPSVRERALAIPSSKIRDVSEGSMGDKSIIPLWFGEPDQPTPPFIREAAKASLDRARTFYTENQGIPALRSAIASYLSRLLNIPLEAERVSATVSGMSAIMIAMEALIEPGDNVVLHSPLWPNCLESIRVMGGEVRAVPLTMGAGTWEFDFDRFFAQVDDRTKAILVNSPNNPTGFMLSREQQQVILDFCRARGIWLLADEVYDRIVFDRIHAPSFLEIATPDDALIVFNSFSKTWCMTGWRLGWVVAPAELGAVFGKLIEFNFSCAPMFVQDAAIIALEQGEEFIRASAQRYKRGHDLVYQRLSAIDRVRVVPTQGGFYSFFAVDGMTDSFAFARRLVAEGKVGLAPGIAFGTGGEGYLRLCFANEAATLSTALDRIESALKRL